MISIARAFHFPVAPGIDEEDHDAGGPGSVLGALEHRPGERGRGDLVRDHGDRVGSLSTQAAGHCVRSISELRRSGHDPCLRIGRMFVPAFPLRTMDTVVSETSARAATSLSSGRRRFIMPAG
jgi:hypothetical protein